MIMLLSSYTLSPGRIGTPENATNLNNARGTEICAEYNSKRGATAKPNPYSKITMQTLLQYLCCSIQPSFS